MKETKSGNKIRTKLEDILKDFKCFKRENVYVTKNGRNLIKAVEIYEHISCYGHNLNLVLKHSVESIQILINYKEKIKLIAKSLNNSILKELNISIIQDLEIYIKIKNSHKVGMLLDDSLNE